VLHPVNDGRARRSTSESTDPRLHTTSSFSFIRAAVPYI
jgi:hypothetical protein